MELKKLAPWNWFKHEEEGSSIVPVKHSERGSLYPERHFGPMVQLHRDIDRIFDHFWRGFNLPGIGDTRSWMDFEESGLFRPRVDLSATDQEYLLTVEIPGVSEKDVSLEVSGSTMTIRGEKKQEKEEKEKDYYRVERSYGSFQRVLSLPEDIDQEGITAGFKNGVLTVTMPRKALPKEESKQIKITSEN